MLFNSNAPEYLKRQKIQCKIGSIRYEEGESILLEKINDLIKKSKIASEKIKFYQENDFDEFNHQYNNLIFYYERLKNALIKVVKKPPKEY